MSSEEMVDVVDENNRFVRKVTRREVREKALLHKAVRVIVIDKEGKLLVKKRSANKDIYPSCWELGVGETVTSGESYESAAIRGLDEELGVIYVSNIQLIHSLLFKLKYRSPNYNANFKVYRHLHNGKLKLQPEEVEEAKFLTASEVKKLIEQGLFEPTSTEAFEKYLEISEGEE